MSDSVRPCRRQPTRFPHPWDSPGKNTGVGCHFLLQCVKVKNESEVTQSCPTLSEPGTAAHQAPLSMGFSRQEYWSGVPLGDINHNLVFILPVHNFLFHYSCYASIHYFFKIFFLFSLLGLCCLTQATSLQHRGFL